MSGAASAGIPLGVCVLPEQGPNRAHQINYSAYLYEILDHAGVCYAKVSHDELRPPAYANWHGGLTILGEGYLVARDARVKHPALAHLNRPLHFFGGLDV